VAAQPHAAEAAAVAPKHVITEYVVLDQAGRLQVPRAYLEEWGIGTRAFLEPTADGILIKPINAKPVKLDRENAGAAAGASLYAEDELPPPPPAPRWRRTLGRIVPGRGSQPKK
jgi:hypothetical protein